jgi:hypothetical protein
MYEGMNVQCHVHTHETWYSPDSVVLGQYHLCLLRTIIPSGHVLSVHTPLNCILCFVCCASYRCCSHSSRTLSHCSHSQTCLVPFLSKFCCHHPGQHAFIISILTSSSTMQYLSHHAAVSCFLPPHHLTSLSHPHASPPFSLVFFPFIVEIR